MGANKKYNKTRGFTIVETLIVLAISSALFLSVALLISGQVSRNQVNQAAAAIEVKTRDILNDVSTGYYPETGQNFTCESDPPGTVPTVALGGSTERGANPQCVFAGKSITYTNTGIDIDTYVASSTIVNGTISSVATDLTRVNELQETYKYPYGVTGPSTPQKYYILNKLLAPSSADISSYVAGGQSISVLDEFGASPPTTPVPGGFVFCLSDGLQLTLAPSGGTNVVLDKGVTTCP